MYWIFVVYVLIAINAASLPKSWRQPLPYWHQVQVHVSLGRRQRKSSNFGGDVPQEAHPGVCLDRPGLRGCGTEHFLELKRLQKKTQQSTGNQHQLQNFDHFGRKTSAPEVSPLPPGQSPMTNGDGTVETTPGSTWAMPSRQSWSPRVGVGSWKSRNCIKLQWEFHGILMVFYQSCDMLWCFSRLEVEATPQWHQSHRLLCHGCLG